MPQLLNPNAFDQTGVIRGFIDWSIQKSGVLSAMVSANQATALKPGDPVKLDSAATGNTPQFVAAAASDAKAFYVTASENKSSFVAGDIIEVAGHFGPIMWMLAEATIAMGATVEQNANGNVQTLNTGKPRGMALLNGTTGNAVPVLILVPTVTQS